MPWGKCSGCRWIFLYPDDLSDLDPAGTVHGFYCGIGCLFLLYGLYRAVGKPGMSVVLTVISLGTRVALAYMLSAIPAVGVAGIWWSVPIGWFLADTVGAVYYNIINKCGDSGQRTSF